MDSVRLGIIGYGGRIQGVIDHIKRIYPDTVVSAINDVRNDEIKEQLASSGQNPDSIAFYDDPDKMLDSGNFDAVMIGTRCSLHSPMAVKVLERNLPLYLEKPVATNMDDLIRLKNASIKSSSKVVVSFPLRVTPLVQLAKQIIDSGEIGTVEHVQAWNNVPYAMVYFMNWYRDENETQGLFLQKATHDFDYINYLVNIKPVMVAAMNSKQVMKGNHPAGLRCDDCPEQRQCLESPFHIYYTRAETDRVKPSGLQCAFAQDTGNEDSGSAIIRYETGMHACYSQNFVTRRGAAKRGASLIGYKGTIEFDWYTDELTVHLHHSPRLQKHKFQSSTMSHGGGDTVLADNFIQMALGNQETVSPLDAGLLSALMCLKAKQSAETNTFQEIAWP